MLTALRLPVQLTCEAKFEEIPQTKIFASRIVRRDTHVIAVCSVGVAGHSSRILRVGDSQWQSRVRRHSRSGIRRRSASRGGISIRWQLSSANGGV